MTRPLRIAMIAEPWAPVPPDADTSAYPQIHHIANALVAHRQLVHLCAGVASHCDARVVVTGERRLTPSAEAMTAHLLAALNFTKKFQPDVIHDFTGLALPLLAGYDLETPVVTHIAAMPSVQQQHVVAALQEVSSGATQRVLVTDSEWIRQENPLMPWFAVVPRPVGLADCTFSAVKYPYLAYEGPLSDDATVRNALTAAQELGMQLFVISSLEHVEEQAAAANLLASLDDNRKAIVKLVVAPDAVQHRQLISRAAALIVNTTHAERERTAIGRALASGTPILLVGQNAKIEWLPMTVAVRMNMREPIANTRQSLQVIDPYECRRVAAAVFSPSMCARTWLEIYRQVLRPREQMRLRALSPATRAA